MKVITSISEMITLSRQAAQNEQTIGLVPTMGALHEGHLSLLDIAKCNADLTVMSIFVNPTQFGPSEDLKKYPRPFEADAAQARERGCDILFAPTEAAMYPAPYLSYVNVEQITAGLCGASRPGHFRGVTTVVLKLFNIIRPSCAVFGQKDAQQAIVIRRMAEELNCDVPVIIAPIIREADGLAMSSRNRYLTATERSAVPVIRESLARAESLFALGERQSSVLCEAVRSSLSASKLISIEYVACVDTRSVTPLERVELRALLAVVCRTAQSGTRLLDNVILGGLL